MFLFLKAEAKDKYYNYLIGKYKCKPKRIRKTRERVYKEYYESALDTEVNLAKDSREEKDARMLALSAPYNEFAEGLKPY